MSLLLRLKKKPKLTKKSPMAMRMFSKLKKSKLMMPRPIRKNLLSLRKKRPILSLMVLAPLISNEKKHNIISQKFER